MGGVGVVCPVLVVGGWLLVTERASSSLAVPLAAVALVSMLGLADDLRPLPARVRFGVQAVLAIAVVVSAWERLPAAAGVLGAWMSVPSVAALAVLWIVWLTNLYNFMDGIDGIAGTQALIASLGLALLATSVGAATTTWLLLALAGSSAGFLLYNLPPSSIFMGDVGSTAIGFLFGVLPLLPEAKPVPFEAVVLALSLFVLDATTTLARRIVRRENWYEAHRTHLYQRPIVLGLTHGAILLPAAIGMVAMATCAANWFGSSRASRMVFLVAPVVLIVVAHAAVARMERRSRGGG